ncbi:hypothetical protein Sango_1589900 [Sesamum angolense]|uniref:ULTRAPETALA1/2 SAND domain-containing protein n=1 Tax=Sesamum angolense TaxID=2727404 RepID=A0AAE2BU03_9LAMI|nr:hypothetical protein Sango_1589900 [Sesamum angolense]
MFTAEELASFHGIIRNTQEFVEIDCGCTNLRYGDTPGNFRAYVDGRLEIDCKCTEDCPRVNLSLVDFARHAGKTNAHNNWMSQIWVFTHDGHKVSLRWTCLLKHHRHTFQRPLRQRSVNLERYAEVVLELQDVRVVSSVCVLVATCVVLRIVTVIRALHTL